MRGVRRVRRFVRHRLHRRLFVWFGATIFVTSLAVWGVAALFGESSPWKEDALRVERFAARSFAEVWSDPIARDALARRVAEELLVRVDLYDEAGNALSSFGGECRWMRWEVPIEREGARLGRAMVCANRHHGPSVRGVVMFLVLGIVLWGASGMIARRITRPLGDLARVAEEIGRGQLDARARVRRGRDDEVGVLAQTINEMAERIERQIRDQRVLLAAVSHELRTPLGHLRILIELGRGEAAARTFDDMEREIIELDNLVGELLASSRLDFESPSLRNVDAADAARQALARAGVDVAVLEIQGEPGELRADATLLARALANLVDNAQEHGAGAVRLGVARREDQVVFEVDDQGPGIPVGEDVKIFEPFHRAAEGGSLGLGLSLVRRIAEAHGGTVRAATRSGGGARLVLSLPAEGPSAATASASERRSPPP